MPGGGPRRPVLTIRTRSKELEAMFAAVAVPEADWDFLLDMLPPRPPLRLVWDVSSGR